MTVVVSRSMHKLRVSLHRYASEQHWYQSRPLYEHPEIVSAQVCMMAIYIGMSAFAAYLQHPSSASKFKLSSQVPDQ